MPTTDVGAAPTQRRPEETEPPPSAPVTTEPTTAQPQAPRREKLEPAKKPATPDPFTYFGEHYEAFPSREGRYFGLCLDDGGRILPHSARGGSPLVNDLKLRYHAEFGVWINKEATSDLSDYIEVVASRAKPRSVPMRSAWNGKTLVIDVGDDSGSTFIITDNGWTTQAQPPSGVYFRRSHVTAAFPRPAASGDLDALWRLTNFAEADRPLVLALLLCSWLTGVAQPVVFITGQQDAGKTVTAQFVINLVDPVTCTRGGSLPHGEEDWKARTSPYRIVLVDNASNITPGQGDNLCKMSTGGEATRRQLYSDDTAHVTELLAPVWLTSIGVGALRGDLQSRMVLLHLQPITSEQRKVLSDLRAEQASAVPGILRGLLDLAVEVVGLLPIIDRGNLTHRMTDFELIVRCIDKTLGTSGAERLAQMAGDLQHDVLDADPVAQALVAAVDADLDLTTGRAVLGSSTPTELLTALTRWAEDQNTARSPSWPRTPKILSESLQRIAPALAQARGIIVSPPHKSNGRKLITIARAEPAS